MLIKDSTWNLIRSDFSDGEREKLQKVITGETICPKGLTIDEIKLHPTLRFKLIEAVKRYDGGRL